HDGSPGRYGRRSTGRRRYRGAVRQKTGENYFDESGEYLSDADNEVWSLDFVADQLADGTRLRALTVVDIFSREALAIEVGKRLRAEDVVSVLNRLVAQRRAPRFLFADNGSEFSGRLLDMWAYHYKVQIDFSRPGKPTDNSFIETFNGSFRDECLNLHWFESLAEAKREIEAWRRDYNETRPHMALKELTPGEFARQYSLRPTAEGS
ncbi:IS3 family transposase, partial [Burkholderia cenocepacia]|uniref:IS3 family transposase n=1 Tax=Burkholderia cenocepacia TaxID=95486 RepID=UPI0039A6DF0A